MKKLILLLTIIYFPIIGFGQACEYGSSIDASELCDFFQGNNFATYRNADIALEKILNVTGMSKRFVLKECNDISNCLATTYKGVRYILYDREFMDAIATSTNSWSKLSILAHEVGHHVNGHTLDLIVYASEAAEAPTLAESRQQELEADEFSGFVMYKLGASLFQAQEAIKLFSSDGDDTYSTHPNKSRRLAAISKGYNKAKKENTTNSQVIKEKVVNDFKYGWLVSYEEAYQQSIKQDKPIMANFTGSDWCGWCKKLKTAVFDTQIFKNWAKKNVILLELDYPRRTPQDAIIKKQNQQLQQTFSSYVRGYPTVLIFQINRSYKQDGKHNDNIKLLGEKLGYMSNPESFINKSNGIIK